jgi:glycosyltransferase involved in cell wall biosynthesis
LQHVHLTVGIPCFNEARNLPALFNDLSRQKLPAELSVEFLVVDDASDDRTAEITQEAAVRDARIRLVRHARRSGSTAAWNTVFRQARGDLLVRIDGDVRLPGVDFLAVLLADHAHDTVPTVRYVLVLPTPSRTFVQAGAAFIYAYLACQNRLGHGTSATLFAAEASLPRALYAELHLPENITANDFYLARLCAARGWPIAIARDARLFVKASATFTDFRRQAGRCRGAHEQVLDVLGPWRQPRFTALPAIAVTALCRPLGLIVFLALCLLCRNERLAPAAMWESAQSTK